MNVGDIKKEIDGLTKKIIERMEELGEVDVMTYRHDQIIKELINKTCELYHKAVGACEYYDESTEPLCRLFRDEPAIIRRLELSEETLCPIRSKLKKREK